MNHKILEYIICPTCKYEQLLDKKKYLYCLVCKSKYPIKNNILILIQPKKQKDILNIWNVKGEYRILHAERTSADERNEATTPATLRVLKQNVNNKSVILNVGSGSGQYINQMKGLVISFDIVPYFVKKTIEQFSASNHLFLVADANDFPFKKNVFDLIFASQVIEHFEKKASNNLLKRMVKTTKDMVLIDTPNDGNYFIRFLRYIIYRNEPMEHNDPHLTHHRLIGGKDLKQFGFKIHGCVGFVTRKKIDLKLFWKFFDIFAWFFPAIGGNLVGIYRKNINSRLWD